MLCKLDSASSVEFSGIYFTNEFDDCLYKVDFTNLVKHRNLSWFKECPMYALINSINFAQNKMQKKSQKSRTMWMSERALMVSILQLGPKLRALGD